MKTISAVQVSLTAVLLLLTQSAITAERALDAGPATQPIMPDPEMLQYLRQLFQGAKQLGRPMINGEMNLLPDGTKGFSNSLKCFSGKGLILEMFWIIRLASYSE